MAYYTLPPPRGVGSSAGPEGRGAPQWATGFVVGPVAVRRASGRMGFIYERDPVMLGHRFGHQSGQDESSGKKVPFSKHGFAFRVYLVLSIKILPAHELSMKL